MELKQGFLFHDRYLLNEKKGTGSFGEVWLAVDQMLSMEVAVKVYIALDDRGVDEFKKEYKLAFALNHPNLLHAYHFGMCENRPYLVMPYCPGSAQNLIGKVDEPTLWRFIHDVGSGLAYLHGKNILHHDIKPDNVLIDKKGNFLITDFGISTKLRSTLRRNSALQQNVDPKAGSLAYMGPELFTSTPELVKATDIWALGVTLYEMMENELPFFGQGGVMLMNGAHLPTISGEYSPNLKKLVLSCLNKETWDRPFADQLVDCAKQALRGEAVIIDNYRQKPVPENHAQSTVEDNGKSAEKTLKKKVWTWAIVFSVVFALCLVLFFSL